MAFDKAKAIRAAEKSLAQGKIPAAIQEYRRIIEHDSADYTALNTLGDLYARVNNERDAVICYRRVAEHYRNQGFALKAIAMYKKITRFVPNDHQISRSLAMLYEHQGLLVEARAQYLVAADALSRAGDTREALEVLRRIADLDPSNTNIRLRLAESYLKENLPEQAAEVYTEAGERLHARGDYEKALDCHARALALRPMSHAALQGLVAAHSALGTADEAAQVLEDAVKSNPGDMELRAMLARSYVEAEDALKAEQTIEGIVKQEPSSYALYFDVARLYLRQSNTDAAGRVLGRVIESALAGRQEEPFIELLQEVLARDPEQMDALHLLVRVHTWQRDDVRLRRALERLADAAETTRSEEEERKALAQLVRLSPEEPRYRERLRMLGGAPPDEASSVGQPDPAPAEPSEVPTFENFVLNDDATPTHQPTGNDGASAPAITDFDWSALPTSETAGGADSVSYDFSDVQDASAGQPAHTGFQEIDFGAAPAVVEGDMGQRNEQVLKHELESVDFYLAQGYNDIARDTLDMLERQYGAHEGIASRRKLLPEDAVTGLSPDATTPDDELTVEHVEFDFSSLAVVQEEDVVAPPPEPPRPPAPAKEAPRADVRAGGGLDAGLAAIFDEFREAVEDADAEQPVEADYETHYNLGLAYREMGLHDQAIEELQTAIEIAAPGDGTPRYLQCCNMLGHCFMEKAMPRPAAMWFQKGMQSPGHTEDEYQALRYELGTAFEQQGELQRAIEVFSEVYAIDVSYRGVAGKLRELEEQKASKS